ncbi:Cof-type HAD-IIB family hydrolase [Olsenella sp. HMSC062G07]|uniref:Cof-type HAD-IIB family hydrolase n=1 Tax=Olsenella sp. HMSC062G07 TaxID=1739330 RepID=UPI0008A29601|nr:HAD family hydrolase [Olsenella sp. HMSC062G07]OFK22304.1 hydrolase [Olsenella sp. HMSC062G07]
MIRLIASDMDGTLLDENSEVPPETFDLILRLRERGVLFAVSSGRRYDTLQRFFEPVIDCMDFVASNGTQVYVGGRMVGREVFSHAALQRLVRVVDRFDCLHLALFDASRSFLFDEDEKYEREFDKNLPNPEQIYSLPDPGTSIIKASLFCDDEKNLMDMAYVLGRELGSDFTFAPSGRKWIDTMPAGINKATGIRQVMDVHGVDASDVMAFGDSMNDYEILRLAGHPRAMGNARYGIKRIARDIVATNADHGVQREMRKLLDELG